MSIIALSSNAAGTGVLTVMSPSTNTNRTATLPDLTGTLVLDEANGAFKINTSGHVVPTTTNLHDLGTSSLRWRNIYTQDLHLSNGIGDYTVVEGEEDLFIVNNKSGKSFKFALIEVDPSVVPPKSNV